MKLAMGFKQAPVGFGRSAVRFNPELVTPSVGQIIEDGGMLFHDQGYGVGIFRIGYEAIGLSPEGHALVFKCKFPATVQSVMGEVELMCDEGERGYARSMDTPNPKPERMVPKMSELQLGGGVQSVGRGYVVTEDDKPFSFFTVKCSCEFQKPTQSNIIFGLVKIYFTCDIPQ